MRDRLITWFEHFVFHHRVAVVVGFALLTALMLISAVGLRIDSSFRKTLPLAHPYVETFTHYETEFGGANRVLIAVMAREGDLFTAEFFETLREVTDAVFFLPGVDRAQVQSLFTPNVRFIEVVEDGFAGGNVIPDDFAATPEGFAEVRENILKSGRLGQLVANDFSGAMVSAQLLEFDPQTGEKLDYLTVAAALEEGVRGRYQSDSIRIHIIGFAKAMGDVQEAGTMVVAFFVLAFVITTTLVWFYSQSIKLTGLTVLGALIAVVWQLGGLTALGFGLDPYSLLVPFLVFAIGVSHGVQMMRAYRAAAFEGVDGRTAARAAFRQLLVPGGVALLTDTLGFLTMLVIKIEVIRELALTASLGVAVILATNLVLLPILLSWVELPNHYRERIARRRQTTDRIWRHLIVVTRPGPSLVVLALALAAGIWAATESRALRIGDFHAGVPVLHPDSRYNLDSVAIGEAFSIGVDLLTVIVETHPDGAVDHEVLTLIDRFEGYVQQVPGVRSTLSLAAVAKTVNAGWNEGSIKWRILPRNPQALAQAVSPVETATGLLNADGSVLPVLLFLADQRAETLTRVTDAVKAFIAENPTTVARLRLASGNAGTAAAINEVVRAAQYPIVFWVFGAVIVLCLLTFRSWRATLCIVLPLILVSLLGYALMVHLEIGLKTATLPVVALGVGIGVDYGIYLFSRITEALRRGEAFNEAIQHAFTATGSAVVFTGLTLAIGVSTWMFSGLKFQADMGVLLTFMFFVNMLAAIIVLPALARWLYRDPAAR